MLDFNKIKYYYDNDLWNEYRVKMAVQCNKITPEQYTEITGDPYVSA